MNIQVTLERINLVIALDKVSMTESIRNAQINNGIGDFSLTEDDLVVEETLHKSQMSTDT